MGKTFYELLDGWMGDNMQFCFVRKVFVAGPCKSSGEVQTIISNFRDREYEQVRDEILAGGFWELGEWVAIKD